MVEQTDSQMFEVNSSSNGGNDDWGIEYEMDYDYAVNLNKLQSGVDEPKLTRGQSYNLIDENEIEPNQKKIIEEVMDTLGVSECVARGLLIKYMWDKECLLNSYYDSDNLVFKLFKYDMN